MIWGKVKDLLTPFLIRERRKMKKAYAILAILLVGTMIAGGASADGNTAGAPRLTSLNGAEERPGPGDTDGIGFATITLNVGKGRVCWTLTWDNIDPLVVGAHIHIAPAGVAGPIVVFLSWVPMSRATVSGCRTGVDPALVQAIIDFPDQYYVNVHTSPSFAGGAIRGQLNVPGQAD